MYLVRVRVRARDLLSSRLDLAWAAERPGESTHEADGHTHCGGSYTRGATGALNEAHPIVTRCRLIACRQHTLLHNCVHVHSARCCGAGY